MEYKDSVEQEISSTVEELKRFLDSFIWKDFKTELDVWIGEFYSILGQEEEIKNIWRTQGRLEATKYILALPERLLEALEAEQEKIGREENGREF